MNEPKQLSLLESTPSPSRRQAVYTPPPADVIDKYAHAVCQKYSEKYGENCTTTEFVQGFRAFVRAIVKARTNQLNTGAAYAKQKV